MNKSQPTSSVSPNGLTSKLERILPYLLIICGVIGIVASLAITIEKFDLLKNPNYHPICDLNPVISCGSVMESKQANAFGFMNTYIGLIGFPILVTIGVAMLAGARFKTWFWLGMQLGLSFGFGFAYWLLFESVYRIHALCPYCLSIDVVITVIFWYVSLYNLQLHWNRLPPTAKKMAAFVRRHHLDILVAWFVVIIALVLKHFWYYFGRNF